MIGKKQEIIDELSDWLYEDLDCLLDEAQTDLNDGAVEENFPRILTRMMTLTDVLRHIDRIKRNRNYQDLCKLKEKKNGR